MPSNDHHSDETTPADGSTLPGLHRRGLLGAVAAAGTASLAGCSGAFVQVRTATDTAERAFDAGDVARIRVEDATDDVTLEHADGDTIRVRARKRARGSTDLGELSLQSRVEDDTLHLGTRTPDVVGIGGGTVDLEVAVPGSVAVDRVRTDDGSVTLRDVSGDATVETGDGDVVTTDVTGDLDASTGDGDVTVERTDGAVTARTGDGDLVVRGPGSVGDLRTGDGDLTAEMPAVDGSATIGSDDGDVTLSLGDALDATIDATTGDGEVSATAAGFGSVGTVTETHVVGTVGDGTNELRVHAGDGDVTLARLS